MDRLIKHLMTHDSTVIIAPQKAHHTILKTLSEERALFNYSLVSEEDFLASHHWTFKEDALFHLSSHFNLSFENASELLNAFKQTFNQSQIPDDLKRYHSYLEEKNLIILKPWKDKPLKDSCVVFGYPLVDENVIQIGKKLYQTFTVLEDVASKNEVPLYRFIKESDEVNALSKMIVKKVKEGTSLNQIKVHFTSPSYKELIHIYFKRYQIPYEMKEVVSLSETILAQKILDILSKNEPNETLYDHVFDALQKTSNDSHDMTLASSILRLLEKPFLTPSYQDHLDYIKYQFSLIKVPKSSSNNAVICDDFTGARFLDGDQLYVCGFNEGLMPSPSLNDRFLDDKTLLKMGLKTSKERTAKNTLEAKHLLNQESVCFVSYSLKSLTSEKIISSLSHDLTQSGRLVKKELLDDEKVRYSLTQDLFEMKKNLDHYERYGTLESNTYLLYHSIHQISDIPKKNTHKDAYLDDELVDRLLSQKPSLSYSKIEDYFKCEFRFLVKHILNVEEPFKERLPLLIGNLYHYALSEIDVLPESLEGRMQFYQSLILRLEEKEKTPFTSEESFYLHHLTEDVESFIQHVKTMHKKSIFKPFAYEKKYTASLNGTHLKTMVGIVDKIMSYDDQFMIIDYKSSARFISFKDYEYGLNSQLPFYMGTVLKETENLNKASGFFYQSFDPKSLDYDSSKSQEELLEDRFKLNGFTSYEALPFIDPDYEERSIIKGVKVKKDGSLYSNAPVISTNDMHLISKWIRDKVSEAVDFIESGSFKINPKGTIQDSPSCKHCEYQAICYKKPEDYVPFKTENNETFLEMIRNHYDS